MFWSSCILASEFCASALQNVLPHNSADTERRSPAPYTPRERFNVIEASASAQIILESETVSHGAHVTATRRRWARSRAKDWHSKRDGDKRVLAFRYFPHERNHFTRRLTREKEEGRPFSPPPLLCASPQCGHEAAAAAAGAIHPARADESGEGSCVGGGRRTTDANLITVIVRRARPLSQRRPRMGAPPVSEPTACSAAGAAPVAASADREQRCRLRFSGEEPDITFARSD